MMYHNTLQNNLATPNSHKELLQLNGSLYALINPTKYQALILGLYRYTREDLAKAVSLAPTYLGLPSHTQEGLNQGPNHKGFDKASNAKATNSKSYHNPIESELKPVSSNTRLIQETPQTPYDVRFGIDWSTLTTVIPQPPEHLNGMMNTVCGRDGWVDQKGVPFDITRQGFMPYKSSAYGDGVKMGYELITEGKHKGKYKATISIQGKWFSRQRLDKVRHIFHMAKHHYGFTKASRIDVCIDDFNYNFIPLEKMKETSDIYDKEGNKKPVSNACGFDQYFPYEPRSTKQMEMKETSYYFGSYQSSTFAIVYPHDHGDGVWSRRMERRYTKRKGQEIFDKLADWSTLDNKPVGQREREIAQDLQRYVIGGMDFVDKQAYLERNPSTNPKRINRKDCERFSWWQHVLDVIGGAIKPKTKSKKTSFKEKVEWLYRQVAKTLGIAREALGAREFRSFLSSIVQDGQSRFTDRELMMIDQLKSELRRGIEIV